MKYISLRKLWHIAAVNNGISDRYSRFTGCTYGGDLCHYCYAHLMSDSARSFIYNVLKSLSGVPRFSVVKLFLSREDKTGCVMLQTSKHAATNQDKSFFKPCVLWYIHISPIIENYIHTILIMLRI